MSLTCIALGVSALFWLAWIVCRRVDNYGFVDVVWSYSFMPVAIALASVLDGWAPRRWAVAAVVSIWSLRLGTHLARRVFRHHPEEDSRYAELRRSWAKNFDVKMAAFFQMQAASVLLLLAPVTIAMLNTRGRFVPLEWIGFAVWLGAILGESVADAQLAAHKRDPATRAGVCERGLWSWSRHPNYFFEWLAWVGCALVATAAHWGLAGWVSPIVMLLLLTRVTGIPMAEARSLESRGEAFRAYQRRTSVFVPWPPSKKS